MATSTSVNVLRYTALAGGIFYGFYHQRSISSAQKAAAAQREYDHKQHLIQQAKAEFAKKNLPAEKKTGSGDIIRDPNDSRFDLEAYLTTIAAEAK